MRGLRKKFAGKVLYSWLISYIIIFSIPMLLSVLLQAFSDRLLKSELYNLEREAVLQMKYICDGEIKSVQQRISSITEESHVVRFLDSDNVSDADEKINTKAAFDSLRSHKAQDSAIEDIYLFSEKNGYLISTAHGANAQDTALFHYEDIFGMDREAFWELLKTTTSPVLVFENDQGVSSLYFYSVIVTDDIRNPTGYILISCLPGRDVFSESDGRMGGIVINNGLAWDIRNRRLESRQSAEALAHMGERQNLFLEGDAWMITKEPSQAGSWRYYYGVRKDLFFSDLKKSRYLYGFYFAMSLLICVAAAFHLARKNFNPVLKLAESIRRERLDNLSQNDITFHYLEESYRELIREKYMLKNQLEQEKAIITNNIFNRMLKGYYKEEQDIPESLEQYGLSFPHGNYRIALWSVDDYSNLFFEENPVSEAGTVDLLHFLIQNIGEECLREKFDTVYPVECDNQIIFILNYPSVPDVHELEKELALLNSRIKEILKKKFNLDITCFTSRVYCSAFQLRNAYMDCLSKMGSWETPPGEKTDESGLEEEQKRFLHYIRQEEFSAAAAQLAALSEQLTRRDAGEWQKKLYFYSLLEKLLRENPGLEELCGQDRLKHLLYIPDSPTLEKEFVSALYSLSEYASQKGKGSARRTQDILKFIDQNICNPDLSLGMIAAQFQITEGYVSRLVKKDYGMQVSAYINHKRVAHTKYLMEHTDLTIQEISQQAGFYSYRTMIRIFRQYEELTPSEYRKKVKK